MNPVQQFQKFENFHLWPMNQRNDTSVNPIPVVYMDSVTPSGALAGRADFLYKGIQDMAGALFSPKTDIPIPAWATHFGYNRSVAFPMLETLARDEFDFKFTLTAGQINLSQQVKWQNGRGMWQWDPNDPPKWADTGFDVTDILKPGPNEFMARCSTDGQSWTLDALECNGVQHSGMGTNVPLKTNTGWTKQMAHWQEQAEVTCVPSYTIKSYQRTQLILSDGPIPMVWL
jgi:hypothetical protein